MTVTTRRVVNVRPNATPAPTARPSDVVLYRRCEAAYAAADLDRRTTAVATPDGVVVGDAPETPADVAAAATAVATARPTPPAHVRERVRALRFRMAAEADARGASVAWMDPVGR